MARQQQPPPLSLGGDRPAVAALEHPLQPLACSQLPGEPGSPLSWRELLGER